MLELIDDAFEAFLRAEVPLSSTDIDVSFDPPNREWSARLVRPTVNLFLWDIRRSVGRSKSGMRVVERDGVAVHQPAMPVLDLRYVLTVWASDKGDERGLLSGVLRAMLDQSTVPRAYLPDSLDHIEPPTLLIARSGEEHMDVFKAVDGQIKPGVNVALTTQFDTGRAFPAGPPTTSIGTSIGQLNGNGNGPETRRRLAGEVLLAEDRGAIGAIVRSPTDATYVNAAGRFILRASPGDEVTLETSPPMAAMVPDSGGIRFE